MSVDRRAQIEALRAEGEGELRRTRAAMPRSAEGLEGEHRQRTVI